MKKGQEYTGTVNRIKFPNKGIVTTKEGDTCVIKNVIAGQEIRFRVTKKRNGQCEGMLLHVIQPSPEEVTSECAHFDICGGCGGCSYQTLPYDKQLELKEKQVHELLDPVLSTIAEQVDIKSLYERILPSPKQFEYRNKMEFSFGDASYGGELELGLHKRGSFYDILSVRNCRIVDGDFRLILTETLSYFRGKDTPYFHKRTHEGFLRFLLVRKAAKTGEILVDLVTTSQTPADTICTEVGLLDDWKEVMCSLKLSGRIVGVLHTIDDGVADAINNDRTEVLAGRDWFNEEVLDLTFKITPFSFFQTNTLSAEVLYSKVREYAALAGSEGRTVFDLYSGTGIIGQLMSTVAGKVIGVEIVEEAVEAANRNSATNGLHNCEFIAGDVLKVLEDVPDRPELIILDPPRDGVNPKALKRIADYGAENIIYVSCKPTSLARDLEYLIGRGYRPVKICPIDQFPGTYHVESCVLLERVSNRKADSYVKLNVKMADYYRIKDSAETENAEE